MKRAKQRPLPSLAKLAGLKGIVRRPEKPVSIEAMNAAIAVAGARAVGSRKKSRCKLSDLMAQIPPGTKFEEIDFGPPVGKEIW